MNIDKQISASSVAEVYEYNGFFWVIEKSFQIWPDKGGPTERVALAGHLPVNCPSDEMGRVCFDALLNFNSKGPSYKPWELAELRKLFCSWVGARGWTSFYKNSRYLWVTSNELDKIKITPVDNCNIFPYESGLDDSAVYVNRCDGVKVLGEGIFKAFKYATYHPDKKV
ncbi:hypothetical protein K9W31_001330 [Salmonella enterica subsp. enterica serovar Kua]|nr:hypothetical protein [Salmonella enterica subsp. houtenae serovar 44:z4,z23:-]ECH8836895.1 hypothetical protein [Salmonella enterica subsp. enterica]EIB9774944.1 hypothetical protein [Salmonella enterica subsp. enterica serovar Kua]EIB9810443.1 hypothetical protein [Salmonella enterica subsp. enterica serovar Kua]EIU1131966.1 hypothetical protein [Salmonella enterica subsp. enterica serovar Kua]